SAALYAAAQTRAPHTEPKSPVRAADALSPTPSTEAAPAASPVLPPAPTAFNSPAPPPAVATMRETAARAPQPSRPPTPEASPRDMLQQANDLRAQHQWLAATQIYEKTVRLFPGRAEAYTAMVAAGILRLDQLGDAKGALALFASAV